jgi:hypothetical protein
MEPLLGHIQELNQERVSAEHARRARALMRTWKAVVLLNLALLVGAGWGYAFWACAGPARARAGGRSRRRGERRGARVTVEGVIRGIFSELACSSSRTGRSTSSCPPMTMGFRAPPRRCQEGLRRWTRYEFTVRGVPPNVAVIAIQKITR